MTPGEDFGSFLSLPPHLAQDLSPCTCPAVPGRDYQVPTSLRYVYDTPRSVLQEAGGGAKDNEASASTKDPPALLGFTAEAAKQDKSSATTPEAHSEATESQSVSELFQGLSVTNKKTKVAPSSDSCNTCTSFTSVSKTIVTICSVCGGVKVSGNTSILFVFWQKGMLIRSGLNKRICSHEPSVFPSNFKKRRKKSHQSCSNGLVNTLHYITCCHAVAACVHRLYHQCIICSVARLSVWPLWYRAGWLWCRAAFGVRTTNSPTAHLSNTLVFLHSVQFYTVTEYGRFTPCKLWVTCNFLSLLHLCICISVYAYLGQNTQSLFNAFNAL